MDAAFGYVGDFDGGRIDRRMRAWDEASPRQSHDLPAMPRSVEGQHQIDHGEAGADQQCPFIRADKILDRLASVLGPWVANIPTANAVERWKGGRVLIAGGEYKSLRIGRRAVLEPDPPTIAIAAAADRRGFNDLGAAAGHRFTKNAAEIPRKETPLGKAAAAAPLGLERAQEMVRVTGNGAHSLGRDVEQMHRFGGGIGNSAANPSAAVDQERANAAPRELRRQDRPRGTTADNRDRCVAVKFRSQAMPPDLPRRPFAWSYGRTSR